MKKIPAKIPGGPASHAEYWAQWRGGFDSAEDRAAQVAAFAAEASEVRGLVGQPAGGAGGQAFLGFVKAPADRLGQGFDALQIRADLHDAYLAAYQHVHALGGILTSSGAVRPLKADVTPGRSSTSLHYTGRAFDLYIATGMQGAHDRYLIARDGGLDTNPGWKIDCVSVDPKTDDPLYDASLIEERSIEYAVWKKDTGYVTSERTESCFCLTDVLASHGWVPIHSRTDWKQNYLSLEWWHFESHAGLVAGVTKFGDELKKVWPAATVDASGLALDAVWNGRAFQ